MDALHNALAIRDDLRAKLRRVEEFIENHQSLTNGGSVLFGATSKGKARGRVCVSGRPAIAWSQIEKVLRDATGPMSRTEIVEACAERGYVMPGREPADYVGIIMFRNKAKVASDRGRFRLRIETAQKTVYVVPSGSPNLLDCTKPEQDAEGGTM